MTDGQMIYMRWPALSESAIAKGNYWKRTSTVGHWRVVKLGKAVMSIVVTAVLVLGRTDEPRSHDWLPALVNVARTVGN